MSKIHRKPSRIGRQIRRMAEGFGPASEHRLMVVRAVDSSTGAFVELHIAAPNDDAGIQTMRDILLPEEKEFVIEISHRFAPGTTRDTVWQHNGFVMRGTL